MTSVNYAPSIKDQDLRKTIAFPFQKGPFNFPALAIPENSIYNKMVSLINTGKGERVMRYDMGVNVHEFVFSSMTPVDKMRLSSAIKTTIETYITEVSVDSVNISNIEKKQGIGTIVYVDVKYKVLGQPEEQQIEYISGGESVL